MMGEGIGEGGEYRCKALGIESLDNGKSLAEPITWRCHAPFMLT